MKDNTGVSCKNCGKGTYKEMSIFDDMNGVLHCDICGHSIIRWEGNKKVEDNPYIIDFEVSGLEESADNALSHYEIKFSEPVNATWLQTIIKNALSDMVKCGDCGHVYKKSENHFCFTKNRLAW